MASETILVADDEREIRELLEKYLKREGFKVIEADCGEKALQLIQQNEPDLVVLDIMMSDIDGYEVLRRARLSKPYLPVIFLSAKQEDYDIILGLGLGADDYVTKPFSPAELTARVKSHLKRISEYREPRQKPEILNIVGLSLDLRSCSFRKNGQIIELTATELKMMQLFMENPERVFTKLQIYDYVWENSFGDDNSVMVYISHLCDKIEDDPRDPRYIKTIRGLGYKFSASMEN